MINLTINIEFYTGPKSLLCLWPSKVEKFLIVALNQQEARAIFNDIVYAVKDLSGTRIMEGARYIECSAGNCKVCTRDDIPGILNGLHGIGVLVTELAYEHMIISDLMKLHYSAASYFD